jgi:hypothetical protein
LRFCDFVTSKISGKINKKVAVPVFPLTDLVNLIIGRVFSGTPSIN